MEDVVVIYHGNCPDGFGGAWAAWKKFGNQVDYIPAKHTDPIPDIKNKEIYFIDFVYPFFVNDNFSEIFNKLKRSNKKITIIDHHITTKNFIKQVEHYSFDTTHSGAVLAWHYFHRDKPVPKLLQYVEDADLWQFQLPHTKEVSSFLELFDFDFEIWDKLALDLETKDHFNNAILQGKTICDYESKLIQKMIENYAEEVEFEGRKALVANFPNFLASELGHALVKKMPPVGIVWSKRGGKFTVSLRSDGTVDVSKIAQKYGGGGHKAAAGFAIDDNKPLPWKKIN